MKVNLFRLGDVVWQQRSGSILVQVVACCLMAPRNYLIPCWLINNIDSWHPSEINLIGCAQEFNLQHELQNHTFDITVTSPRGQWVNLLMDKLSQIAKFMGSTWGPSGSCRPQMGPVLASWTLLSWMGCLLWLFCTENWPYCDGTMLCCVVIICPCIADQWYDIMYGNRCLAWIRTPMQGTHRCGW